LERQAAPTSIARHPGHFHLYSLARQHQPVAEEKQDFTGHSQPNRDFLTFLSLCAALDLLIILKPGPFIHAETNYGGLPDWVCPSTNSEIEMLLDFAGRPVCWPGSVLNQGSGKAYPWPLPSPFGEVFMGLTHQWLSAVGKQVISPFQYPNGPVLLVQIANEGLYSNGQQAPWHIISALPPSNVFKDSF
jgi:beta-galactosidase